MPEPEDTYFTYGCLCVPLPLCQRASDCLLLLVSSPGTRDMFHDGKMICKCGVAERKWKEILLVRRVIVSSGNAIHQHSEGAQSIA